MYLALSILQECHVVLISKRLFHIKTGQNCCKKYQFMAWQQFKYLRYIYIYIYIYILKYLAPLNTKLKFMKLRLEILKLTYLTLCLVKLINSLCGQFIQWSVCSVRSRSKYPHIQEPSVTDKLYFIK